MMLNVFFLQNRIFHYRNPLRFETEPYSIHTIPLLREHLDSYLYYIRYKTYYIAPSQTQFQVIFNLVDDINTGVYNRTTYPQNIQRSIKRKFNNYLNKLNLDKPIYRPSLLENFQKNTKTLKSQTYTQR